MESSGEKKKISRRRRISGELAQDETATFAEVKLRCEVFYAAVDSVIAEINERFSSSRHVLETFAIFSPKVFSTFSEVYPTTGHVEENVRKFCETHKIDSHHCAVELYSFAVVFKLFNFDTVEFSDSTKDTADEYGVDMQGKYQTFADCLSVLTDSRYKLSDAYPTLV